MSLLEIKNYLMRVKIASLASLSQYFDCDSDVLRNMLSHWIRKGCVRKCAKACTTPCGQCNAAMTEIYEWIAI